MRCELGTGCWGSSVCMLQDFTGLGDAAPELSVMSARQCLDEYAVRPRSPMFQECLDAMTP